MIIKVSVIIAVYNAEEYLEKCLESLLRQTLEEIEIIAVDDGSKDKSPEILERYAAKHDKVKYLKKENGGAADARNFGLAKAGGEYVGYIDSDDFADPDMYELMYTKAKESGSDVVECGLHHTYEDYEDTEIIEKYYDTGELLCFGRYVVWNKIYRRDWMLEAGAYFPINLIYEDVAFVAKLVPYIKRYDYIEASPVHYVQRQSSVNNSKSVKTMDIFLVLRDINSFYREKGFYEQYKTELEYLYVRILLCSSFARMCRIPDKSIRKRALKLNWDELVTAFPKWQKNPVLKKDRGRNALFMKMQNPLVYKICGAVFPVLLRIKKRRKTEYK